MGSVTTKMTICEVIFLIGSIHALTQSLKLFPNKSVAIIYVLNIEYDKVETNFFKNLPGI